MTDTPMTPELLTPTLNEVYSVRAGNESGLGVIVSCNLTDNTGNASDCEYASRPSDMFGLNPTIRQWLADNSDFSIALYLPPSDEAKRPGNDASHCAAIPRWSGRCGYFVVYHHCDHRGDAGRCGSVRGATRLR